MKTINSPRYMRLPKKGERDPLYGISRSSLNNLILPCEANGFNPPVASHLIKISQGKQGIRLIDVQSLDAYVLKEKAANSAA